MPASAGGFSWKADGDFRTLVYIKNEADTPKRYTAHLNFLGGGYSLGIREIKNGETTKEADWYDPSYGLIYSSLVFDETANNNTPQQVSSSFWTSGGLSTYVCPH
ncbi:MAG TPA: hypothetical protein DEA22_08965 [Blastocatellia bacterium]|nr:hypothetical protein [Blastocatellia bacterium]